MRRRIQIRVVYTFRTPLPEKMFGKLAFDSREWTKLSVRLSPSLSVCLSPSLARLWNFRIFNWWQSVSITTSQSVNNPSQRSVRVLVNPLQCKGNYIATSNNMKLVHWPLMGGLLHLVQRGGDWAGPEPAQAPPRCTKCNSPPINGQCTNNRIAVWWSAALRF